MYSERTAFSSDIRGLIALPDMPADVDPDWLYRAVCDYDTADYTATEISDVYFVKPASYLVISEVKLSEYLQYQNMVEVVKKG